MPDLAECEKCPHMWRERYGAVEYDQCVECMIAEWPSEMLAGYRERLDTLKAEGRIHAA